MKNRNKIILLATIVAAILILTFGVTYALFTYQATSTNSELIVGDIYMHYNETNQLTIENAMPSSTYDASQYFEFTIDGKNTYTKKDIWYEIVLSHGDNHETRTTRLADKFLRFRLTEIVDGVETEIFTNRTYDDLTSKRIWVATIPKNTTTEIIHTYRLYMWISDSVTIGDSEADYDMETWNNDVFASIKVGATGDFNEKEVVYITSASCFETTEIVTYTHNTNMTSEELNKCVTIFRDEWEYGINTDETWESYCDGTGTRYRSTFQKDLYYERFSSEELLYLEENNIIIDNGTSVRIRSYDTECGSDVVIPDTINGYSVTTIGDSAFQNNQLTSVMIPDSVTTIGDSAFAYNQLTSVMIPDSVTTIGSQVFEYNQLTSVVIPESVWLIGDAAFYNNQLTSVVIPESVTEIDGDAFRNNQLTNVTIPDSVTIIKDFAFYNNQLTNVAIPDSVTYLSCYAFDDTVSITKNDNLICIDDVDSPM